MGLFKTKAQREQERKMKVKQSMRELEKRIQKLKAQEAKYVEAAKIAMREELPDQIKLAEKALSLTISERKRTYKMLLNAQIISQMKDMSAMTGEFLKAIQIISKDISKTTDTDMSALTRDLRMAMEKVEEQTEGLEEMMEDSQESISAFADSTAQVSDDELTEQIYRRATQSVAASEAADTAAPATATAQSADASIDAELEELKRLSK